MTPHLRPATPSDADAIWDIFRAVVAGRDTYAFAPDTPRAEGVGYWFGPDVTSYVATLEDRVVGMYKLIANRRDLGSHVANASFMVHPTAARRGVGRAMGMHCLREARAQGYDAMQFNFVVSTNQRAVALWQSLGFRILATLPRAFRHGSLGLVDAYVMHRSLDDIVLTFGAAPSGGAAVPRPSAYAIVANANREVALVHAEEGTMLPGGGIDTGESATQTVIREVEEECALRIAVSDTLGEAIEVVYSQKHATHFEKRSSFFSGDIVSHATSAAQHQTRWLPIAQAIRATTYESHAWAMKRWARLNS